MALINLNLFSEEIEMNTDVVVIYPDKLLNEDNFNVLFLLHGYNGSHLDWLRHTTIEKLAVQYNIMVVMPAINNSFYTNMVYGYNYFNYYTKELRDKISKFFKINLTKDNTYITGLSMGGYGALKAALTYPQDYKGVASFSGVLDIKEIYNDFFNRKNKMIGIFGDEKTFEKDLNKHDLFLLTNNLKDEELDIYISCGTEDFLFEHNKGFVNHLNEKKIKHEVIFNSGDHNWEYWQEAIKRVLKYFFE